MTGPAADRVSWTVVVAVNEDHVLNANLLRSPDIDSRCQVIGKRGYASAGQAYNEGLDEASNDLVVLVHSDVYLPQGWLANLRAAIARLDRTDPDWGVLGVCGRDLNGGIVGHVYSSGSCRVFGAPFADAVPTLSIDEMVIVTRKSAGLRFEPGVGFHLYGTDICLEARAKGRRSYVVSAFCIHNSNGIRALPDAFWHAYFFMRRKWWHQLPVRSCCVDITWIGGAYLRSRGTVVRQYFRPSVVGTRVADPLMILGQLGDARVAADVRQPAD